MHPCRYKSCVMSVKQSLSYMQMEKLHVCFLPFQKHSFDGSTFSHPFFIFSPQKYVEICGTKLICGWMRGRGCSQRGHKVALFDS